MMKKRAKKNNLSSKQSKTRPKLTSKKKRIILCILLFLILMFTIAVIGFVSYVVVKAPKFNPNNLKFTQMTELYDRDNNLVIKLGNENRTEIEYDDLPEVLLDEIVAT